MCVCVCEVLLLSLSHTHTPLDGQEELDGSKKNTIVGNGRLSRFIICSIGNENCVQFFDPAHRKEKTRQYRLARKIVPNTVVCL